MAYPARIFFYAVLPLALFLFSYSGGLQVFVKAVTVVLKHSANAELKKIEASGFTNDAGNAEYVVSVEIENEHQDAARQFLLSQQGILAVRPTDFSDWFVIEVSGLPELTVPRLREMHEIGFVFANRGVWFCH